MAAINASFQDAKTVLEDAQTQVEALSTDDPQAFATELNEIGVAIQSSLGGIGDSLWSCETPELSEAVRGRAGLCGRRRDDRDLAGRARLVYCVGQLHMGVYWLRPGRIIRPGEAGRGPRMPR